MQARIGGKRRRGGEAGRARPWLIATALTLLLGLISSGSPAALTGITSLADLPDHYLDDQATTVHFDPQILRLSDWPDGIELSNAVTGFGAQLLPVDVGVVAIGYHGSESVVAAVAAIDPEGPPRPGGVVVAQRSVAAAGDRLVAINTDEFIVYAITPDGGLTEQSRHRLDDGSVFGPQAALGGPTLVVALEAHRDGSRVAVFDLSSDTPTATVALGPNLDRIHLAVDPAGALVAISGVAGTAELGEVQFFRRQGQIWLVDARLPAVGGGPIVGHDGGFLVQRNGFFTRPQGAWNVIIDTAESGPQYHGELSAPSGTITHDDDLIAFGDGGAGWVLVFSYDPEVPGLGHHAQTMTAPPLDNGPWRARLPSYGFGSAILFSHGRLVISAPNAPDIPTEQEGGAPGRGGIVVYQATAGPRGCTIVGTNGDDELRGTSRDDVICGLGGNDILRGGAGRDRLYGGPGNDDLQGEGDDDLLVGGDGNDRLAGGAGNDWLFGGPGNDQLFGGEGNDYLDGGPGNDTCAGGGGNNAVRSC